MAGGGRRARRACAVLAVLAVGAAGAVFGTPQSAAATSTFSAEADTYVSEDAPSKSFGASTQLVVDGAPVRRTFVRFAVAGLSAPVVSATLRLRVADVSGSASLVGGTVRSMSDTTWDEGTVTWSDPPVADGPTLGQLGRAATGAWVDLDVTAAVPDEGSYGFEVSMVADDSAIYDSRESASGGPQLVVVSSTSSTTSSSSSTTTTAPERDPILVGAGDIAGCKTSGDEATAALLDEIPGTVFTIGDNAYDNGTLAEFNDCYGPSWGRHKERTRPVPGNHEYNTTNANGHFRYFGAAGGDPDDGYYSYDLGSWHVVAINSNCSEVGGCGVGSRQEKWLRADLAASTRPCTVAYWHHPLFTSGADHPASSRMRPLFKVLYEHGAEVVVSGHNHNYERFAPQTPAGELDEDRGIRQFVVGTGGKSHYGFNAAKPNSEVRNATTFGVLELTLRQTGYDWRFVPEAGGTFTDSGSGDCH